MFSCRHGHLAKVYLLFQQFSRILVIGWPTWGGCLGWMSGKEGFSGVSLALCNGPVVVECGFPVVFFPEGPGGPVHPPHQVTGRGTVVPGLGLPGDRGCTTREKGFDESIQAWWYARLLELVEEFAVSVSKARAVSKKHDSMALFLASALLMYAYLLKPPERQVRGPCEITKPTGQNKRKGNFLTGDILLIIISPLRSTCQALSWPSARTNRYDVNTIVITLRLSPNDTHAVRAFTIKFQPLRLLMSACYRLVDERTMLANYQTNCTPCDCPLCSFPPTTSQSSKYSLQAWPVLCKIKRNVCED